MRMNNQTDQLIRDQLAQLPTFPGKEEFDRHTAWSSLQSKMERRTIKKVHFWKYAAAFLILIAGLYGSFQLIQDKKNRQSPAIGRVAPIPRERSRPSLPPPSRRVLASKSKGAASHDVSKKKAMTTGKSLVSTTSVSPAFATQPMEVIHPEQPFSTGKNSTVPRLAGESHVAPAPSKTNLTPEKLRVVHFNELGETEYPNPVPAEDESRSGPSLRLTDGSSYRNPLAANQYHSTDLVKFHISH